jgi:hypothetical protein
MRDEERREGGQTIANDHHSMIQICAAVWRVEDSPAIVNEERICSADPKTEPTLLTYSFKKNSLLDGSTTNLRMVATEMGQRSATAQTNLGKCEEREEENKYREELMSSR